MFTSTYLDVAIGLIFIFLLLSLLVTILNEIISSWLDMRALHLRKAIEHFLSDHNGMAVATLVYNHPLVRNPANPGVIPSYISADKFSNALIGALIMRNGGTPSADAGSLFRQFEAAVGSLPNGALKTVLESMLANTNRDIETLRKNIEKWFDDSMDRATGWYKRNIQRLTFLIGLILCFIFNADTFSIIHNLIHNRSAREKMVQLAEGYVRDHEGLVDSIKQHAAMRNDAPLAKLKIDSVTRERTAYLREQRALLDSLEEKYDQEAVDSVKRIIKTRMTQIENATREYDEEAETVLLSLKRHVDSLDHEKRSIDSIYGDMRKFSRLASQNINSLHQANDILGFGWKYAIDKKYKPCFGENSFAGPIASCITIVQFLGTVIMNVAGLVLTALALLLGAPFWFDLLKKLIHIRNAGNKPSEKKA